MDKKQGTPASFRWGYRFLFFSMDIKIAAFRAGRLLLKGTRGIHQPQV